MANSLSSDQTRDLKVGPTRNGVHLEAWKKVDSYKVIRVVQDFKTKTSPNFYGTSVLHGVLQGSVLGPLLFLVLMNDLGDGRVSLIFVDYTTIKSRGRTLQQAMEVAVRDFRDAKEWFVENNLLLNDTKTQNPVCTLSRDPVDGSESAYNCRYFN